MITKELDLAVLRDRWDTYREMGYIGGDREMIPLLDRLHNLPGRVIPVWHCSTHPERPEAARQFYICLACDEEGRDSLLEVYRQFDDWLLQTGRFPMAGRRRDTDKTPQLIVANYRLARFAIYPNKYNMDWEEGIKLGHWEGIRLTFEFDHDYPNTRHNIDRLISLLTEACNAACPVIEKVEQDYTFYWKDGFREVGRGISADDAMLKLQYGELAKRQVGWVDVGVTDSHVWSNSSRQWERRQIQVPGV